MRALGYDVFETSKGFQLQADDEVGVYKSDRDAICAAINDTLDGNILAAEMLKSVLLQEEMNV